MYVKLWLRRKCNPKILVFGNIMDARRLLRIWTRWSENADFKSIFARSASAV